MLSRTWPQHIRLASAHEYLLESWIRLNRSFRAQMCVCTLNVLDTEAAAMHCYLFHPSTARVHVCNLNPCDRHLSSRTDQPLPVVRDCRVVGEAP